MNSLDGQVSGIRMLVQHAMGFRGNSGSPGRPLSSTRSLAGWVRAVFEDLLANCGIWMSGLLCSAARLRRRGTQAWGREMGFAVTMLGPVSVGSTRAAAGGGTKELSEGDAR